ncbi:MAG: helix-turn-helix transcriptional regulator [Candidatus Omnitrophica bacterium]|nr:helix-turn-helix transcriptional regulator [Candidatus Omnitrophota bacterium]
MELGKKIRQLRKEKNMTLDDLSKLSGLGKATLSRIENNIHSGTLKTHMKICEALGISLKDFYSDIEDEKEEISAINPSSPEAEIFSYDEKATSVILTQGVSKKNMLPQLIVVEPGGKTSLEENPRGTEKFIFCLEGTIEVVIAEKKYALRKDGTLYFKSSFSHYFTNESSKKAKILSVTSPIAL